LLRALPFTILGLLAGAAAARWAAPSLLAALGASSLARTNYRKRVVVAGLGLLLPLGLLAWAAPLAVAGKLFPIQVTQVNLAIDHTALAALVAGLAYTILGLLDDLVDDGPVRGFRGHLAALAGSLRPGASPGGRGLTGGAIKLLGGALAGLLVASLALDRRELWAILLGGIVVASAANVANLFDLRPGRCAKVFLPLWVVGFIVNPTAAAWSAGLAGATAGALPTELREEGMLGDTGANALGGVVGALLVTGPLWLLLIAAVVLVALQLASERISFTRVIEGNRWLRRVDGLGRVTD
jgi:UDP-GlcNAc:undecaprenyl-phosphate/decaprenyl-phosphate GlcNAc-1-phosphate transferase